MEETITAGKNSHRWIIASIGFAVCLCTLDSYIVNISLPTIASSFGVGANAASRIVIAYLLVLTSTILFFGKLADRVGVNRVFLSGYIVFIVGSLLCGLSQSLNQLLIARCIQGFGGAVLYTVPSAIVTQYLPPTIRGAACRKVVGAIRCPLGQA